MNVTSISSLIEKRMREYVCIVQVSGQVLLLDLFFYKFFEFFCYVLCLSYNRILQSKLIFVRIILKVQQSFLWLISITKIAWTAEMIWKSLWIINGPKIKAFSLMRERNSQYCWPVVGLIFLQEKHIYLHWLFNLLLIPTFEQFWNLLYSF